MAAEGETVTQEELAISPVTKTDQKRHSQPRSSN